MNNLYYEMFSPKFIKEYCPNLTLCFYKSIIIIIFKVRKTGLGTKTLVYNSLILPQTIILYSQNIVIYTDTLYILSLNPYNCII